MKSTIDRLIINSPYEEPAHYWSYVREVLGEMANAHGIIVINDEAHHAWRIPAESKVKGSRIKQGSITPGNTLTYMESLIFQMKIFVILSLFPSQNLGLAGG